MKCCQSCGMPLQEEVLGTKKDGSKHPDYCMYCYKDGEYTWDCTMEEMISFCTEILKKESNGKTEAEIEQEIRAYMPTLQRWKK